MHTIYAVGVGTNERMLSLLLGGMQIILWMIHGNDNNFA